MELGPCYTATETPPTDLGSLQNELTLRQRLGVLCEADERLLCLGPHLQVAGLVQLLTQHLQLH